MRSSPLVLFVDMHSFRSNPAALEHYRITRAFFDNGEFFRSYDLAREAAETWPEHVAFAHLAVLSLANAGALDLALKSCAAFGLDRAEDPEARALLARLNKDLGFAANGSARLAFHREARALYEQSYAQALAQQSLAEAFYPAINAAALAVWCDDLPGAARLAAEVLAILKTLEAAAPRDDASESDRYWRTATEAEACLILGRFDEVARLVPSLRSLGRQRLAQVAATERQLRRLARALHLDPGFLAGLTLPAIMHFSGHIIAPPGHPGRFPADRELPVRARIDRLFAEQNVGAGYGSLAAGADILFAEALLARGGALHVILPFAVEDFLLYSVTPAASDWTPRFHACLAAAHSIRYATEEGFLQHDDLFQYCSHLGMGLAVLAGRHMQAPILQCVVWDGVISAGLAGTVADMAVWQKTGFPQHIVPCTPEESGDAPPSASHEASHDASHDPAPKASGAASSNPSHHVGQDARQDAKHDAPHRSARQLPHDVPHDGSRTSPPPILPLPTALPTEGPGRHVRAMLFGDLHGFSRLSDRELPIFAEHIMGPLSAVVHEFRDRISFVNTWGDGIFVVLEDVRAAAAWALRLQESMLGIDLAAAGLPPNLQLRLGGHLGPVYSLMDPILERLNFYGTHVSRAARIEPVTPEGCVYVTETFAAILALNDAEHFACDYAGYTEMAKHYGQLRIFVLRRVQGEAGPTVLGDIERPPIQPPTRPA